MLFALLLLFVAAQAPQPTQNPDPPRPLEQPQKNETQAAAASDQVGIQVPNTHKPGPLPDVVLPVVPGRPRGVTEIEAVIAVDEYKGVIHGRNGEHEIVEGHITLVNAVANRRVVDTRNVEVAMNIASPKDKHGLPSAIPVKPGDLLEIEGEYIPAKRAKARNARGAAAVLHFTHAPAGYVIFPDARMYR